MEFKEILYLLPNIEVNEIEMLIQLTENLNEEQKINFLRLYRLERKDPNLGLVFTLFGFSGFAGIQRFYVNDIAFGVLYLITAGFCFVGTVIDIINYKDIVYRFNNILAKKVFLNVVR
jgi:TM2 domain-containing membrane protein YozV